MGFLRDWLLKIFGLDPATFDAIVEFINMLMRIFGSKNEAVKYVNDLTNSMQSVSPEDGRKKLAQIQKGL